MATIAFGMAIYGGGDVKSTLAITNAGTVT